MTIFRPHTSFPYLKIARECNVPYGKVIRFVENIAAAADWQYLEPWEKCAAHAWHEENQRRSTAK